MPDGYDAADNSRRCYDEAIRALRLEKIRAGECLPMPGDAEEIEASPLVKDAREFAGVSAYHGDCLEVTPVLGVTVDAIVTDPPYHLTSIVKRFGKPDCAPAKSNGASGVYARASRGFIGQTWDGGNVAADPETWRECFDRLKPGGHLLAFGGTRTYHRMACAIEDAGFEIRDCIMWVYGSGFPKSRNIGDGWGTALKPACEPVVVARKPLSESSIAANVLKHRTGGLNVNGCRVAANGESLSGGMINGTSKCSEGWDRPWRRDPKAIERKKKDQADRIAEAEQKGRWPANLVHDGSDDVVSGFPEAPGQQRPTGPEFDRKAQVYGEFAGVTPAEPRGDSGSAARFFYCAKADAADRLQSKHPTVKPVALMVWLVRLVTPPGGLVLDPFAGSGTTGMACMREGFRCILIEQDAASYADILRRGAHVRGDDAPLFAAAK